MRRTICLVSSETELSKMIEEFANLINNISLVLLAVAPTVFVFSVTLLGDAIERSQQEEKAARENEKNNVQKNIDEVEKSLIKARENGDTQELTNKLDKLRKEQRDTDKKIKDIRIKYSAIDFINTVVYSCAALMLSILISLFSAITYYRIPLFFIFQIFLVLFGTKKIYTSLSLVQKISTEKKAGDHYDRLKTSFRNALEEYYKSNKEDVEIEFTDKDFPLNVATSTELSIGLRVGLRKGSVLKEASVWFFIADGLELISPSETKSWRQSADYNPPNIRTVKLDLGDLSIGSYVPRTLKIKTPSVAGKYLLRYTVKGLGYSGSSKDLTIIVL